MAALVQLQGEIIDNIETNVKSAKNHVQKAEVDIKKSKENLISARKVYFKLKPEKMLYPYHCSRHIIGNSVTDIRSQVLLTANVYFY